MRERWEQAGKETRYRPRKGIKLRAAQQSTLEAARAADGEETRNFVRRKSPNMGRVGFQLGRLHTTKKSQAIVKRADIRHSDNDVSSNAEFQRHLVTDPEEFFRVFEYLVCDEKIHACVVQGESFAFEIKDPKINAMPLQELLVSLYVVNANQARFWESPTDQSKVIPIPHPQVACEVHLREAREHLLDDMPPVLFLRIDKP